MKYQWPIFDKDEIDKVSQILHSGQVNYWTGEEGRLFEKEFSSWCKCNYSVAVANGSVSLSLALHALNISRGDEIIVPPRSFVATASAPALVGAKPIFADVDRDSQAITAETIEPLINKKTKAIIVVHLGGWPAKMSDIIELAKIHNLYVIEDCAQAHGAQLNGKSVGSFGDISCWSFCQDKNISTAGEGGMVSTSNKELFEIIWSLKDHGKDRLLAETKVNPRRKDFRWLHKRFGTNLRLTEIQAAIGRSQLKKIESWQMIRERNAQILIDILGQNPAIRIPRLNNENRHGWYKFYAFVRFENLSSEWSRIRILEELYDEKVTAFSGGCGEIYLEDSFKNAGLTPKEPLPIASELGRTSLMFQIHPTITIEEIERRALIIDKVLKRSLKK